MCYARPKYGGKTVSFELKNFDTKTNYMQIVMP